MQFWSIESILLGLGAVILAVDQALEKSSSIRTKFPSLRVPGWVKVVPLLLWVFAGGVWLLKPGAIVQMRPTYSTVSGVELKRFADLSKAHTSFEFGLLMQPYKGVPVAVSGIVEDISSDADGNASVTLADTVEGYAIDMDFKKESSQSVFRLIQGNRLSAKCEFSSMGSDVMAFVKKCELVTKP